MEKFAFIEKNNIETFDTSGIGYVEDLNSVLKIIDDKVAQSQI